MEKKEKIIAASAAFIAFLILATGAYLTSESNLFKNGNKNKLEKYNYVDVTVQEAKTMIEQTPDLTIIDISPYYADGHIPGAVNYNIITGQLDEAMKTLDKNKKYLVYCHFDNITIAAAEKMINGGFKYVYRLLGNFQAWKEAGYKINYGTNP